MYYRFVESGDEVLIMDSVLEGESSTPPRPPWWLRIIFGKNPKWTLVRLLLSVTLITIVFRFLLVPIKVTGQSMEPTYVDGRINFVNQLAYSGHTPQRGDVVAVHRKDQNLTFLKRIVGMPGERVAMKHGRIFINGTALAEPYVKLHGKFDDPEKLLDEDFYFVIGDNRQVSNFGAVHIRHIMGKVLY
jgi:signal peptidase I